MVDTYMPFTVLLGDNHDVGQPFRVLNFSNKVDDKEFVNFLFYDFSVHWMEASQFMSYRFMFFLKV